MVLPSSMGSGFEFGTDGRDDGLQYARGVASIRRRRLGRLSIGLAAATAIGAAVVRADVATIAHIQQGATANAPAVRLTTTVPSTNRSLRFFGTGSGGIDRVVVGLSATTPVNVGATDFTIEFWLKGSAANNPAVGCSTANDAWINGHVVIDRDVYGGGDRGDFGVSLLDGRVVFGASKGAAGATVCGATNVLDGVWHHVAVTRRATDGRMQVWVDGAFDGGNSSSPASGNINYRVGRTTSYPADPTLVFGAEKHDAGSAYPSFNGWLDDVRVSTGLRYTAVFVRPSAPLAVDATTVALYAFDEGTGTTVGDAKGTSPGSRQVGGANNGPQWSTDVPVA